LAKQIPRFVPQFILVGSDYYVFPTQTRKLYRGAEVELHLFLTSVRNGGEWSASRSGHFTLGAVAQLTCWISG